MEHWESGIRPERTPAIIVNGEFLYPEEGAVFGETVIQAAFDANIRNFHVYAVEGCDDEEGEPMEPGDEYLPGTAPSVFAANMVVELKAYDTAG